MDEELNRIFAGYTGHKSEIIPILQDIQDAYGYLPEDALEEAARFTGVSRTHVYGVATFYAQFRFKPRGRKHIMVCTGTACHVSGAEQVLDALERHLGIEEGDVTDDMEYSLESVGCIGCCSLAPCAMVNDEVVSRIKPSRVGKIFPKKS
ncbi:MULTISPECIES: NADH-quinone oxidoreductase subunit NuoE [Methanothermobacter]|jgi:NADH-quinone oxidoreductase subunit E|uniref:NADH-quinone oxidoreductase subunit NuoE n=1 Tax=Methanothermobacter thermautotrophicus TaxID=145262 RepID=A0A7J4MWE8_METTF|nr:MULTISPECIES: NADH-quinone oxidoreductase subunit NuoE [Methanothermobacter]MBC7110754.1 NADH-quinone oxidoreductase subunit NuoE [Methanothermobacter sp.]MDI6818090.1 NADH-quinone oxidoreductase subunit NuoE [Methanothermobacter thermautotrophicus]MDK2874136.1 NADH-quinone oxidoreductase subunit [Methanothermobacter sp.]MDN5373328.1 NADH-quinone oxidoreductase subunit [Methanothermobacter sp.]WBF07840.1 NADH-quinone oxidoreductase subunit NuoE [Methanothermobacter thermautotrophicus]